MEETNVISLGRGNEEREKKVLEILSTPENLNVREDGIRAVLRAHARTHPGADVVRAAYDVVAWSYESDLRSTDAVKLLNSVLKRQRSETPTSLSRKAVERTGGAVAPNPYVLRCCEKCKADFGVRQESPTMNRIPFVCQSCEKKGAA